jgi:hypothetical protein
MNTLTKHEPLIRGTSKNPFCGPAALALLLNRPLDGIDSLLKEKLGSSIQKGIFYPLVIQILEEQGCKVKQRAITTFDIKTAKRLDQLYLICYKEHFGVSKFGFYHDNQFPNGTEHYPRLRIEKVFEVTRP